METILIAGLGNPGKKYARTRHNAGFMFVDHFFETFKDKFGFLEWETNKKLKSLVSAGHISKPKSAFTLIPDSMKVSAKKTSDAETRIILLKPRTFMNLSGQAVSAAKKYYKVKLENIFVVHDEIDLPLGTFRFSKDSSSAGHKGVQDIIDVLGTKNFTRLRIGIDKRACEKIETEKYVLGKFTDTELKLLREALEEASKKFQTK